jgi:hypothetical protein
MDKSFLRGRRQRVVMGNNVSGWEKVTSGVLQGSVLGPLLFVIYINDMPEVIKHSSCKLYADNSKLISEIKDEQDAINLQLDINCIVKRQQNFLRIFTSSETKKFLAAPLVGLKHGTADHNFALGLRTRHWESPSYLKRSGALT